MVRWTPYGNNTDACRKFPAVFGSIGLGTGASFHGLPFLLTLTVLALLTVLPVAPSFGESPYGDAYEKSRDEYKAVSEGVSKTKDYVENTKKAVDAVEAQIRLKIQQLRKADKDIPDDLKDAAAKLKNARMTLKKSHDLLSNFGDYSEKVTTALDVYDEIVELNAKMEADREAMGDLAANLQAMSKFMEKGSKYVPILGDAIKDYSTITTKMVDKLGEVSKVIDKQNQERIGRGTRDTNSINRAFHEFQRNHPELRADLYVRSVPAYLYEPEGVGEGSSVMWDAEEKKFYIVPEGVPATDVFKMMLLMDKRLPASDLKRFVEHWNDKWAPKLEVSRDMQELLNGFRGTFADVLSRVSREGGGQLYRLLRNPKLFDAMYVFDPRVREQLHRDLQAIHDGLVAEGALDQAADIRRFARQHNLGITFAVPENAKTDKKKDDKKKDGDEDVVESIIGFLKKAGGQSSDKQKKEAKKTTTETQKPAKEATKETPPQVAKPVLAEPAVKPGTVVDTCGTCSQYKMDCACGRERCRCCAPGDSNCNGFGL